MCIISLILSIPERMRISEKMMPVRFIIFVTRVNLIDISNEQKQMETQFRTNILIA